MRLYGVTNKDQATIDLADGFVSYLTTNKDRILLAYNGLTDTTCFALGKIDAKLTCPSPMTKKYSAALLNVEIIGMSYLLQFRAAGGRIALEGTPLLDPDMSTPNVAAAVNYMAPERYDMWGVDAGSLNYERNNFTTNPQNASTLAWLQDTLARQLAQVGENLLLAIGLSPQTRVAVVTVRLPANLVAGVQTITGVEPDPSQPVYLNWHTYGTPEPNAGDWVKAAVDSNGNFSAAVNIDHSGITSTMFYRLGSGPVIAAWSGTPQ